MNVSGKSPKDNEKMIIAFLAMCVKYARRHASGELSLQDAVDYLQDWAFTRGLVETCGQDRVQQMISYEFEKVKKPDKTGISDEISVDKTDGEQQPSEDEGPSWL